MSRTKHPTSIRLSDLQSAFLNDVERSAQWLVEVGFRAARMALQTGNHPPCIYVHKTAVNFPQPADLLHQEAGPCRACCPACPIRNLQPIHARAAMQLRKDVESNDLVVVQHQDQEQTGTEIADT